MEDFNQLLPVLAGHCTIEQVENGQAQLDQFLDSLKKFTRYKRPEWDMREIEVVVQESFMHTMKLAQAGEIQSSLLQAARFRILAALKTHQLPGKGPRKTLSEEEKQREAMKETIQSRSGYVDPYEPSHEDAITQKLTAEESLPALLQALNKLKPDEKQIVYMRAVEGMLNTEVAEKLGRKVNSVSRRYKRAIEKLQRLLNTNTYN
jgi:RNA polymerase sigma factor (sigma-70 family)